MTAERFLTSQHEKGARIMTEDNKKSIYWTGGVVVTLVVVVGLLWMAGLFGAGGVQ